MTAPGAPDPRGYPAPGSAAPGSPPPLKRALTPADGVLVTPAGAADCAKEVPAQSNPTSREVPGAVPLRGAVTVLGVAVGLELAGIFSRRRNTKSLT